MRLPLCLLMLSVSGCGSGSDAASGLAAALALEMASSPVQNAVVWTVDDQGEMQSHWVRGGRGGIQLLATRPGLVMVWNQTVWLYEQSDRDVPLCDCRAWELLEFDGDCPLAQEPGKRVGVSLLDIKTQAEKALLPVDEIPQSENAYPGDLFAATRPVASLGNYLFVLHREQGRTCDGVLYLWADELVVVDLETQGFASVLTDAELDRLAEVEQKKAYERMRSDLLSDIRSAEELELMGVMPSFDGQNELRVTYHFTARASYEAQPDAPASQSRYSQSIAVPSESIPAALAPFGFVPPIVRAFALGLGANQEIRIGGWFPVIGTPDELAALLDVFTTSLADEAQSRSQ